VTGATRAFRHVRTIASVGLLVVWALTLRPHLLGGPATYLVVRGTSMLPTYETGDLVILRDQSPYKVGDAVGYAVPAGEVGAGRIVLHRIIATSGDTFILQGDNNDAPDPWTPAASDVAGRIWIVIPGVGRVLAWLHEPATAGAIAAALIVAVIISRGPPPEPGAGVAGAGPADRRRAAIAHQG
jgi:signal peptidase